MADAQGIVATLRVVRVLGVHGDRTTEETRTAVFSADTPVGAIMQWAERQTHDFGLRASDLVLSLDSADPYPRFRQAAPKSDA